MAQTWPAGATLDDAIHLQMPPQGLSTVALVGTEIVPEDPFALPTFSGGTLGASFPGCLADYGYDVTNAAVEARVLTADVIPSNGQLTLQSEIEVTVNRSTNPILLELGAVCIEGDCNAWVDPFIVDLTAPVTLNVVGGELRATIGTVSFTDTLTGDNVVVTDCTAGSIIDTIRPVYDPYELLVDYARDEAAALIPSFVADFQLALDDVLQIAQFHTSIDLFGATLDLDFEAESVSVTNAGVDIQVNGRVFSEADPCMDAYDTSGSRQTAVAAPSVTTLSSQAHLGGHVSTDILDQGLFAVWRSGLFCQTLSEGLIGPFNLDTALLTVVGGPSYAELLPETKPMTIKTAPTNPPVAVSSANHDLAVAIEDLGVDFFAELDGRQAHVFGVNLSPEVGVDAEFSNTFGTLVLDLTIPEVFDARLRGDPMVADANEVVTNVENVVGTLAESTILGLLGDSLSFELPTFESPNGPNFGLRDLTVTGSTGGWTTAESQIGTVTYNGTLGCDEGCTGSAGCSTGGSFSWGAGLFVLVALRRRTRPGE